MEPDAVPPLQAAADPQPHPDLPREERGVGACGRPLAETPINECKRELDAVLAALGDA